MEIKGRKIGLNYKPYIIAEMSNNHNGSLDKAYALLDIAKKSNVDAVKIQTYTADSLTIDCHKSDFIIPDKLWKGKTYYELYKEISMPLDWNRKIFDYAKKIGVTIFSSPFDEASVELLEGLNTPAYKIASFESKDWDFLKVVARTKKPVIFSTGVSTLDEIIDTLDILRSNGSTNIAALHCISSYPAKTEDMNLDFINELKKIGVDVGISDHSLSLIPSTVAISMGASIVEKHYTNSRKEAGPDSAFSLEPEELTELKKNSIDVWKSIGSKRNVDNSRLGGHFSRSLYFVKDLSFGDVITKDCIRSIRPGFGLNPNLKHLVIGKKINANISAGDRVSLNLIKDADS
jgi:N-acetylneuraminate synthase